MCDSLSEKLHPEITVRALARFNQIDTRLKVCPPNHMVVFQSGNRVNCLSAFPSKVYVLMNFEMRNCPLSVDKFSKLENHINERYRGYILPLSKSFLWTVIIFMRC